ncbi:Histamine N-methyltransferase [Holothuria leucospilota]|uniref:Histamine N-methyltransferase n=1 Tax=Holothuria leucospilota TaxID=206669 RepID=A0A9Q1CF42_HOLLE|nr:Histamine N-methyltransferase [Holothuria leucospilota]
MSMMSCLPDLNHYIPLKSDTDRLAKCTKVCKQYSNEDERVVKWLRDEFIASVANDFSWRCRYDKKENPLRMIGVASGTGVIEMSVISELLTVFPFIDVTVIEPCRESIDAYKALTEKRKLEFKGVSWNWCQETFQTFSQRNSDRFDFICAIHALYFSPLSELKEQLLTLHEMLDDGGIIFSLHDKGTTCLQQFEKLFPDVNHPLRPSINSDLIKSSLKELSFSYRTIGELETNIEATECLIPGSEDGSCLLDAFIQVVGFTKLSKSDEVQLVQDFLKTEEVSFCLEGRWFVDMSVEMIVINSLK